MNRQALDLRARTRAVRPPAPKQAKLLNVATPTYEAALECDRLIRAMESAEFAEPLLAGRGYAQFYGQGFPLVDRLLDAIVQAPLKHVGDGTSLLQTAARRMFTWLDVETTLCPYIASTNNGKYHVVDPDRRTHTLCNRRIVEQLAPLSSQARWNVGAKRGVWQIALGRGDACSRCANHEKVASIPMLAETSAFDVLNASYADRLVADATAATVAELVRMNDGLWGGGAISNVVWTAVRSTIFDTLVEEATRRAVDRVAEDPAWVGRKWINQKEPNWSKRELIAQIEMRPPQPNEITEAIRAVGSEMLFRHLAVDEDLLEKEWVQEVGVQLIRRCWPGYEAWE